MTCSIASAPTSWLCKAGGFVPIVGAQQERRVGGTVEFVMIPPRSPTRSGAGSSSTPLIASSRYDGISFATFDVIFLVLGQVRNVRARTRGTQGGQENVMSSYSSKLSVFCH